MPNPPGIPSAPPVYRPNPSVQAKMASPPAYKSGTRPTTSLTAPPVYRPNSSTVQARMAAPLPYKPMIVSPVRQYASPLNYRVNTPALLQARLAPKAVSSHAPNIVTPTKLPIFRPQPRSLQPSLHPAPLRIAPAFLQAKPSPVAAANGS